MAKILLIVEGAKTDVRLMKYLLDIYDSYTASMEELSNKKYKQRVQSESRNNDYRKFAVNKEECDIVIKQNYEKAMKICGIDDSLLSNFKYDNKLLKHQLNEIRKSKRVFVICTCVFYILDYDSRKVAA